MKILMVVFALSASVLVLLTVQAVRQELHLRGMKNRIQADSAEFRRKEGAILDLKAKVQKLKSALATINSKIEELNAAKTATQKTADELRANIEVCEVDKGKQEKKRTEWLDAIAGLKNGHDEEKKKIEAEIQLLKQQILERDVAICAFVDPAQPEGVKLCGMSANQKSDQ